MLGLLRTRLIAKDAFKQEVCHHGAIIGHSYPHDVVKFALGNSGRLPCIALTGAAGGGQNIIPLAVTNSLGIPVHMPREDSVIPVFQERLELLPVFIAHAQPHGFMHKYERPADPLRRVIC